MLTIITTMFSGNVNFSSKRVILHSKLLLAFFFPISRDCLSGSEACSWDVNRDHTRSIVNIIYVSRYMKTNLIS